MGAHAIAAGILGVAGTGCMRVTGDCMRPSLLPGETVVLEPRSRRPPRLGDVVLLAHPEGLRLHRLVWSLAGRVRTMGDSSPLWDPALPASAVLAVATGVAGRPGSLRRPGVAIHSLLRAVRVRVRMGWGPR